MTFKYVITIDGCIIFAPTISHDKITDKEVLSAGFVRISTTCPGTIDVDCYGRSESLDIDSHPAEDERHIRLWGGLL